MNNLVKVRDYENILNEFLSEQDISEKSKKIYRIALMQFFKWVNNNGFSGVNISKKHILKYKDDLREQHKSNLTINCYLTSVRRFFSWTEEKRIFPNITKGVKGVKRSQNFRKEPLTKEQVIELLSSLKNQRDRAIITLMIFTGIRTIELQRANIEDIRFYCGKNVLWIQGKGHEEKDEFVILETPVLKEIQKYLITRQKRRESESLFTSLSRNSYGKRLTVESISRIVKKSLRNIMIDDSRITAHSLRHTAVTFAILQGATLQEAQMLARHKNIGTTMVYAHNLDRITSNPEHKITEYLATKV